jgi:hypothetical protein
MIALLFCVRSLQAQGHGVVLGCFGRERRARQRLAGRLGGR